MDDEDTEIPAFEDDEDTEIPAIEDDEDEVVEPEEPDEEPEEEEPEEPKVVVKRPKPTASPAKAKKQPAKSKQPANAAKQPKKKQPANAAKQPANAAKQPKKKQPASAAKQPAKQKKPASVVSWPPKIEKEKWEMVPKQGQKIPIFEESPFSLISEDSLRTEPHYESKNVTDQKERQLDQKNVEKKQFAVDTSEGRVGLQQDERVLRAKNAIDKTTEWHKSSLSDPVDIEAITKDGLLEGETIVASLPVQHFIGAPGGFFSLDGVASGLLAITEMVNDGKKAPHRIIFLAYQERASIEASENHVVKYVEEGEKSCFENFLSNIQCEPCRAKNEDVVTDSKKKSSYSTEESTLQSLVTLSVQHDVGRLQATSFDRHRILTEIGKYSAGSDSSALDLECCSNACCIRFLSCSPTEEELRDCQQCWGLRTDENCGKACGCLVAENYPNGRVAVGSNDWNLSGEHDPSKLESSVITTQYLGISDDGAYEKKVALENKVVTEKIFTGLEQQQATTYRAVRIYFRDPISGALTDIHAVTPPQVPPKDVFTFCTKAGVITTPGGQKNWWPSASASSGGSSSSGESGLFSFFSSQFNAESSDQAGEAGPLPAELDRPPLQNKSTWSDWVRRTVTVSSFWTWQLDCGGCKINCCSCCANYCGPKYAEAINYGHEVKEGSGVEDTEV